MAVRENNSKVNSLEQWVINGVDYFRRILNINRSNVLTIVANILLIILAFMIVNFQYHQIKKLSHAPIPFINSHPAKSYHLFPSLNNLSLPLFGKTQNRILPLTHWQLLGVIVEKNTKNSLAVIDGPELKEQIFQVGDKLPDGSIIMKILPDQILLNYHDVLHHLLLVWDQTNENNATLQPPGTSGEGE